MTTVTFSASVQAAGGPQLSVNRTMEVEAYDRIEVTLAAGVSDLPVQIQPGTATKVAFLAVTSDLYAPEIRYKISDGTVANDKGPINLDQPQVFTGGAIGLFGIAPNIIRLTNTFTDALKKAQVVIFVGRKAT